MLKALELYGFKSFADRTRFEFPEGITVVVGPNGSGKSNIVDAIKWVLGSQSAKSLRGKEMADVIFKGGTERKPAGAAEASIFFDNSRGSLPYDAEEVQVTRRVYRSGESEYLINGAPCRLKDVKDLVRGTGIGIDAYSLIEQGKVDRMLQANPKDRRAIFEEAAGISRFKAKKVEAERRLLRVQNNLRRLGDIVDEVRGRLESLRSQASKAERYRLKSERMRHLRTQLAWTDWRALSHVVEQASGELERRRAGLRDIEREQAAAQAERETLERVLQQVAARSSEADAARNEAARKLAGLIGTCEADHGVLHDLQRQVDTGRRRLQALRGQAGSAVAELRDLIERHREATDQLWIAKEENNAAEVIRGTASQVVEEVRRNRDDIQNRHLEALRRAADLEGALQRHQQQIDASTQALDALHVRLHVAQAAVDEAVAEGERCRKRIEELDAEIDEQSRMIEEQEAKLSEQQRLLHRLREESSAVRIRLQGVRERALLLEDLARRQEGLTSGVRTLIEEATAKRTGPYEEIVDLVANLIETDVHVAPLIDVALGPLAQYVVVQGDRLQRAILAGELSLTGRVGLFRLDQLPPRRPGDRIRLDGLKGVVGRADRLVRVEARYEPLARHLLGTTWLVDTIHTALGLQKLGGAGLRFVTGGCDLIERDGSIVVGPISAASGLVSRRSELGAAQRELAHYEYQLEENEKEIARLAASVESQGASLTRTEKAHRHSVTLRASAEAMSSAAIEREESRRSGLADLVAQQRQWLGSRDLAGDQLQVAGENLRNCREGIEALEIASAAAVKRLEQEQGALRAATEVVMQRSVHLARIEQRVEALEAALQQQQRDQSQRDAAVQDVRQQLEHDCQRRSAVERRILESTSSRAAVNLECESLQRLLESLGGELGKLRQQQQSMQKLADSIQRRLNRSAEGVAELEREREAAEIQRRGLSQRVLEDYQLDLLHEQPPADFIPPENRSEVEAEISELRSQLQQTGSVNMEALEELQQLQDRFDTLYGQYSDLDAARQSLERIILKINLDSRRLFLDTLEAIRGNFQVLYRKSFGGGSADLVLEEEGDPLEAGVEIVATPPGKPSFANSLLSGGEKALTAVALLMAIFQYRPSPFCVLDEVDAPFDEANIGRFVKVLGEFLAETKFVIVTHSKKTMTAANTLYGVTMQESGVSKQVNIRFEDVSDDGRIDVRAA